MWWDRKIMKTGLAGWFTCNRTKGILRVWLLSGGLYPPSLTFPLLSDTLSIFSWAFLNRISNSLQVNPLQQENLGKARGCEVLTYRVRQRQKTPSQGALSAPLSLMSTHEQGGQYVGWKNLILHSPRLTREQIFFHYTLSLTRYQSHTE